MELTFAQQLQQFVANNTIMVVAWVALLVAVIFNLYRGATSKFKIVDNAQATQLINKEEGVVIDLRSDTEFAAGHIINSVHVLPSDIKANKIQTIEKYQDRPVILVDANGFTAPSSANLLTKQGFNKVYVLKEGIVAWRAASLPLVKKQK